VYRRVLYTFADVPLNARGLVVSQIVQLSKSISTDPKSEALTMVSMPALPR
jgi:hypothetical protein